MTLDSQQQKNQLFNLLNQVQISGPFHEAVQQVVQTQDLIQAVAAAEIRTPGTPAQGGQVPEQEESSKESTPPVENAKTSGPPKAVGKGMAGTK